MRIYIASHHTSSSKSEDFEVLGVFACEEKAIGCLKDSLCELSENGGLENSRLVTFERCFSFSLDDERHIYIITEKDLIE